MALSSLHEACFWLADAMEQYWSGDEALNRKHSAVISGLRSSFSEPTEGNRAVLALMPSLVSHVNEIIQNGQPDGFKTAILSTLADSTREVPFWRPLFGLEARPDGATNENEMRGIFPPDCVVEVARRVVSEIAQAGTSELSRSALRIIANCCADNNVNRFIIVERGGIETMLGMVTQGLECDLVIPTLYNVCVDYDEPARDATGQPWVSLQEKRAKEDDEADSNTAVNAAEQRLGTYWLPHEGLTSFEILLKAKDSGQVSMERLADLIEMASRAALCGTHNFVHQANGHAAGDVIEIDTTADIVHSLLTHGFELAKEDTDCRASICQAVLNLLSQADTHHIVARDSSMIWNLIHLPHAMHGLDYEDDDTDEDEQALAPYREPILKMVYSISAAETYEQVSESQSPLIRNCIGALEVDRPRVFLASICVLLANSVVSKERAEQLIRSAPNMANFLSELITKTTDSGVLLPALSLATRLSLCPEGQDAFHQTNMASAVSVLLASPKSEIDSLGLEIQRDAVVLVRLIIKGRLEYLPDLACNREDSSSHANIMVLILSIFDKTSHPDTKTEIGRLSIEVLRTLLSSRQQLTNATEKDRPDRLNHKTAESLFQSIFPLPQPTTPSPPSTIATTPNPSRATIADTISWILTQSITQSQSQSQSSDSPSSPQSSSLSHQAEAEAWFGFGLLSTFPSTHSSIRAALARDDFRLLKRLREIALLQNTHSSRPGAQSLDPRYENIKVLVARMGQQQQPATQQLPLQSLTLDTKAPRPSTAAEEELEANRQVQAGLEAAAAEMGLDWVFI
ncbi:uncharacterized protein Z520_02752 [Fonsecaea multimorphosa CBS 102226]|uniref:Uncharacterized protein n=1 Tax=Fonsecaea multimorphosa CBS 102226 TaxID=1442371 RepID=A0A0D2KDB2_9EURO|nr:uncharacterized protein Z520_02752 [Fonsecaea multimorphosa CBS 102226]KIY01200.1 hypothetical protein Z520_02752 [Fonsecaea multimorphosa CBS 102226]OAL28812.1 hypothetical protein AYO22_02677 [Fonsecaea multimorphosa]